MLKFKAAIFDVDDTILDNEHDEPGHSLHERSRLRAVHTIADEEGIPELRTLTAIENLSAFLTASEHSTIAAVWNVLYMKGLVTNQIVEPGHELLQKIIRLKNELHERILIEEAKAVPGAIEFIHALAGSGLEGKLAVASSAIRHEIELFFGKTGIDKYFSNDRIKAREDVEFTKPNPEVFHLAFNSLGLAEDDRASTIVFEDDPRGIMAAVAAGLTVCAITTRFDKIFLHGLEIPPHYVIEHYDEAYAIVGIKGGI